MMDINRKTKTCTAMAFIATSFLFILRCNNELTLWITYLFQKLSTLSKEKKSNDELDT